MTDVTPPLPAEDTSFLDAILDWSEKSTPRIDKKTFVEKFLPLLASDDKEVREKGKLIWESSVAKSRSVPVYVLDESGEPAWLVPPIFGTMNTGFTASPMSIESRNRMVDIASNRLVREGIALRSKMYTDIKAVSDINQFYQMNWYVILRDFGYLKTEDGAENKSDDNGFIEVDDEYDY